jgi:hypothetical protein
MAVMLFCRVFSAGDESPGLLECGGGRGGLSSGFFFVVERSHGFPHQKLKHMSAKMQGEETQIVDSAWAHLASRALRAALIQKGVSYADLARRLVEDGIQESERSIEGKVHRGTFRFTFFLQALSAAGSALPGTWLFPQQIEESWEARATRVLRADLSAQPWLDTDMLSRRLEEIGVRVDAESLESQIADGTFSAPLYFQCAAVCRFDALWLYLDISAVNEVALNRKLP